VPVSQHQTDRRQIERQHEIAQLNGSFSRDLDAKLGRLNQMPIEWQLQIDPFSAAAVCPLWRVAPIGCLVIQDAQPLLLLVVVDPVDSSPEREWLAVHGKIGEQHSPALGILAEDDS